MSKDWGGTFHTEEKSWTFGRSRRQVKLVGGFYCELDANELNEWHELLDDRQVYHDYIEAYDLVQILESGSLQALEGPSVAGLLRLHADQRHREQELYVLGKAWYADLVETREKVRPADPELEPDRPGGEE